MRILLVDDSAKVLDLLRSALENDYDVVTAQDGLHGWLLASGQPHPDLIIADVEMPRLNGVSLAKRLRARADTAHIPIIFLTSRDGAHEVIHGIKLGVRYYLTKPFDPRDVRLKVAALLSPIAERPSSA